MTFIRATLLLSTVLLVVCRTARADEPTDELPDPRPDTDVVFVAQRLSDPTAYDNVKLFMQTFVNSHDERIEESKKPTVRFAAVTYDNAAETAFNFTRGLYLNNVDMVNEAIDNLPPVSEPGANLPEALMLAGKILTDQSNPSLNAYIILISDCLMDTNQGLLADAINLINQNYTTVVVIRMEDQEGGKKRRALEDGQDVVAVSEAIVQNKDNQIIVIDQDFVEIGGDRNKRAVGLVIDHIHIIINHIYPMLYVKICTRYLGPCMPARCGVGHRFVEGRCSIYRWTPYWTQLTTIIWHYYERCCVEPCRGDGLWHYCPWMCRYLPPYNGLP